MNKLKNTQGHAVTFIIIGAIVALLIALGIAFWNNFSTLMGDTTNPVLNQPTSNVPSESTTDNTPDIATTGSISGNVVYPIEFISNADRNNGKIYPSDLQVCAIDATTKKEIVCEKEFSKAKQTYELTITPGSYLIKATTGSTVAYYDLYVKDNPNNEPLKPCAATTSEPIVIAVASGQAVEKIDAADFWVGHLGC